MELKYLNTFMTIVQEGSFTKAAARLNYSQSTITFQIGQLEEEFSTRLFERSGRTMRLTKAGEQFVPYVENALSSIEQIYNFQEDLADFHGELHIGTLESLLCYYLPPVLQEFSRKASHAKIFIHVMECKELRDTLSNGSLDIGILYEDGIAFGSNLEKIFMGTYSAGLFASPTMQRRHPDFVTRNRDIKIPLIADTKNCPFRKMLEGYLNERAIQLDHVIEIGSVHTMKQLVEADMGVTFLPHFTVDAELSNGSLVEIQTKIEHPSVTAVCCYNKKHWVSPAMQLFIDLCHNNAPCDNNL